MKAHGRFPADRRRPEPITVEKSMLARSCDEPLILRALLAESLRRLRAGRRIEESHGVVHPEMSCIIRDTERLARRLNDLVQGRVAARGASLKTQAPGGVEDDLTAGL